MDRQKRWRTSTHRRTQRRAKSLSVTTLLLFTASCFAQEVERAPFTFAVQWNSSEETRTLTLRCAPEKGVDLRCDEAEISVGYYRWDNVPAAEREP